MARSNPNSTNPNTIKTRRYREKKRAEKLAQEQASVAVPVDTPSQEVPMDTGPQIDVVEPDAPPKLGLWDRLGIGKKAEEPKPKTAKKGQRGKQIDANLMTEIFPTMLAGSIALYAQKLVKNPYKPCAPTQKEVLATVGPLFSILGRRIQIVGSASEDIIDLINSLLAATVTGIRIHITYLTIQEEQEAKRHGHDGNAVTTRNGVPSQQQAQAGREVNPSPTYAGLNGYAGNNPANPSNGHADLSNGNLEHANPEADVIAQLFSRDIEGRQQLGLLYR